MRSRLFYKLARPDGWDFYTGKTINYRQHIGEKVICPGYDINGKLCSVAFIYASRLPDQCFVGAKIPCSAYKVEGVPIKSDVYKCGFKELQILEELQPINIFKWDYYKATNPTNPFEVTPPTINQSHIILVKQWALARAYIMANTLRATIGTPIRGSVRGSIWYSVEDSIKESIGHYVWDSVKDSMREFILHKTSIPDHIRTSLPKSMWGSEPSIPRFI